MSARSGDDLATAAKVIADGLVAGGVNAIWSLPDSICNPLTAELAARDEVTIVKRTAAENVGVARAQGAALGGRVPAVPMEASGLGLSTLTLHRGRVHRAPLLIIASHPGIHNDDRDYHSATIECARDVMANRNIPHDVLTPDVDLAWRAEGMVRTCIGQKTVGVLFIPPGVL